MIAVIDYGLGNLGSLENMLLRIGEKAVITSNIEEIKKAEKLIISGVGSFDNGMKNIEKFIPVLEKKVLRDKAPILAICLGMQLFTERSEEGEKRGLGWIRGETVRFKLKDLKIPHMGWNIVFPKEKNDLFCGMEDEIRFYFVHSYHLVCPEENILAKTNYGLDFASAVRKDNIYGVQFHPEKSHKCGMEMLENFVKLC